MPRFRVPQTPQSCSGEFFPQLYRGRFPSTVLVVNVGRAHFLFRHPREPTRRRTGTDIRKNRLDSDARFGQQQRPLSLTVRCQSRTLAFLKKALLIPTQGSRAKPVFAPRASALPLAARPAAAPPLGFPRKRLAPPPRLRRRPSPRAPLRSPLSTALPSRAPLTRCTLRGPPYLRRTPSATAWAPLRARPRLPLRAAPRLARRPCRPANSSCGLVWRPRRRLHPRRWLAAATRAATRLGRAARRALAAAARRAKQAALAALRARLLLAQRRWRVLLAALVALAAGEALPRAPFSVAASSGSWPLPRPPRRPPRRRCSLPPPRSSAAPSPRVTWWRRAAPSARSLRAVP